MQPTARPFSTSCRTVSSGSSRYALRSPGRLCAPSGVAERNARFIAITAPSVNPDAYFAISITAAGRDCHMRVGRLHFDEQRFILAAAGTAGRRGAGARRPRRRCKERPVMDRPIAYDKLAREERFVRMRAREVAEIKVAQGLPPFPDLSSRESIKERVHGIMVGELQAMEGAGRSVCDFPEAPWEFTMDMARQVWDESRHVEIYLRLLEHLEGYAGEYPETTILWRWACAEDAAARVAGVNRGLEGLACDVFNQLVHIA